MQEATNIRVGLGLNEAIRSSMAHMTDRSASDFYTQYKLMSSIVADTTDPDESYDVEYLSYGSDTPYTKVSQHGKVVAEILATLIATPVPHPTGTEGDAGVANRNDGWQRSYCTIFEGNTSAPDNYYRHAAK